MNSRAVMQRLIVLMAIAISPVAYGDRALPDFTQLVEERSPGVVNISTTKQQDEQRGLPPGLEMPDIPEDSPLNDLLERFLGEEGQGRGLPQPFDTESLGSGFIVSEDGYIITNYHVAKDADEIIVKLSDRREFVAELVGTDPRSDLALLKIDAEGLPMLQIGDSRKLKRGEWVLAIGSPFGFEHSVTAGIVSAKGRSLPRENYVPFIQTDVAINPGNSGGPLFNLDGEVVGINSQIYSRTGGFMGLSFAIPIEVAMDVADQLRTQGRVSRGWIGVYIQEMNRELAESFDLETPTGALVARVIPDSPAQKAGLRPGDVILSYRGREVDSSASLPPMVGRTEAGKTVELEIMRDGEKIKERVTIEELPEQDPPQLSQKEKEPEHDRVLGIDVAELDEEQRDALEIENGLQVTRVHAGPAREAGIRKGDVLLMMNNQELESVQQFRQLVNELPEGKYASVLVHRGQGPEFIAIEVPPSAG